ncbi:unnamed protein product [Medioppia subpectinata]|uniref:E2 ubiquitin-conjugating enzyme n=1 Tax=Medioppia subpectinata TaxID=1979941 RepID=A0A7R9KZ02_9ACAR|nr:unnamed protein product [Medioppia subpectinata]CAG2111369.1 unnamed protein product [Medioppia subpectinata]
MVSNNRIARNRLAKELEEIERNPPIELSVGPVDDNLFHWEGILHGPLDSPYEGGLFRFRVDFTADYPNKAPKIRFISRVFHPNISRNGDICVDLLQKQWSSAYTLTQAMICISSLLTDPNTGSPLNPMSAQLYETDRQKYNSTVREWVRIYASAESLDM